MSVMSEGLIEVQKKIAIETSRTAEVANVDDSQSLYDKVPDTTNIAWNFEN